MNITLTKILIIVGLILLVIVGIFFGYYKFSSISTELNNVKSQNTLLTEKSNENKDLYSNLLSKIEKRDKQYEEYIKLVDETNKKQIKIIEKYNREIKQEQLKKLLEAKPVLVEKILNRRIDEIFKCIQKSSNDSSVTIVCHFD